MSFIDATGLTQAVSEIKAYCVAAFAAITHTHAASDVTSGQLAIANGGTGATTATAAKTAIVDGQALAPSSVAATGDVTAVKNNVTYSLGTLGESVSKINLDNIDYLRYFWIDKGLTNERLSIQVDSRFSIEYLTQSGAIWIYRTDDGQNWTRVRII